MGKKRKQGQPLEEVLARPWCYYCDRDFDDVKILVDHQKAKHYQCHVGSCHRRLNTAGGLRVHMAQVHKEELHEVPNALPHRKELNIEVFGMVGVPDNLIEARNNIVRKEYHKMETEHMRNTGNPLSGTAAAKDRGEPNPSKKPRVETKEELKARIAEAKAKREAAKAGLPPPATNTQPMPVDASEGRTVNMPDAYKAPAPPPPDVLAPFRSGPPMPASSSPPVPATMPFNSFRPQGPLNGYPNPTSNPDPSYHLPGAPNPTSNPDPLRHLPQVSHSSSHLPQVGPGHVGNGLPGHPHVFKDEARWSVSASPDAPEPRFAPEHPTVPEWHFTPEPQKTPDPQLTSKQHIDAQIDSLWEQYQARKAAQPDNAAANAATTAQATAPPPTATPAAELPPITTSNALPMTTQVTQPASKRKLTTADRIASGKPAHSMLVLNDNFVPPEEKRARARRYQPKSKASTIPTFAPTQGVAGAVDY